jgi:FHS family L-fucose permease-like MFS transporter
MLAEVFRKHKTALILTFGVFALWGVGHRLYDTLVPEFAKAFALNSSQLVLTQSVYDLVYFILAVPAAMYARTFGSKATIVFGLGSLGVGAFLFYPAALQHEFLFFLFAAAVMSCGYIFLEIAANPLVAQLGPPETATRRLNFAHALYPIGLFIAIYIGRWVILSDMALPMEKLANAVVQPYMVLGGAVLLLAFIVDRASFPAVATQRGSRQTAMAEFRTLLCRPWFLAAVGAQFCNVAGQAGAWTLMASYVKAAIPAASESLAADFLLAALIMFGIGRFTGAILTYRFNPNRLLAIFAGGGVVAAAIAIAVGGEIGVYAMVAFSFSSSILFATILGAAIGDLGPLIKSGTALVLMGSSAGAAVGIAAMHLVWTASSIQLAMIVALVGCLGVVVFALARGRVAAGVASVH